MNILARIVCLATTDRGFYQALRQDMDAALATTGFCLTEEERAVLQEWLNLPLNSEQASLSMAEPESIWIYPSNLAAAVLQGDCEVN